MTEPSPAGDSATGVRERLGRLVEEREGLLSGFLEAEQDRIARACHDMARAFARGGILIPFGSGAAATDAAHLAVEFMHPVIVGKRALPALAPSNDPTGASTLARLARPDDIALGLAHRSADPALGDFLAEARRRARVTIAMTGGEGTPLDRSLGTPSADYSFVVPSNDPEIVQEVQETVYHVLWELVHVFFEHPGLLDDACITCGDVAVAARVVALRDGTATIELEGAREDVAVDLVEGVEVGDMVLCHAGVALEKIPQAEEAFSAGAGDQPVPAGGALGTPASGPGTPGAPLSAGGGGAPLAGPRPPAPSVEPGQANGGDQSPTDPTAFLYPFLESEEEDTEAVLADVSASTLRKGADVNQLRRGIDVAAVEECARAIRARLERGGRLIAFGNGGSSTDAQDVAGDCLARGWPGIALNNDVATVTAVGNDVGYDNVFARQLIPLAHTDDVALAISTSGSSQNIVVGLEEARRRHMLTCAITGYDGGRLAELDWLDHIFIARSDYIPRLQEAHATIYHLLLEAIGERAELRDGGHWRDT